MRIDGGDEETAGMIVQRSFHASGAIEFLRSAPN